MKPKTGFSLWKQVFHHKAGLKALNREWKVLSRKGDDKECRRNAQRAPLTRKWRRKWRRESNSLHFCTFSFKKWDFFSQKYEKGFQPKQLPLTIFFTASAASAASSTSATYAASPFMVLFVLLFPILASLHLHLTNYRVILKGFICHF